MRGGRCTSILYSMKPLNRKPRRTTGPLQLSKVRQMLSPLVRQISAAPKVTVPISVHGEVQAYLVSAERFEQLMVREREMEYGVSPHSRLRGSIEILGGLELASGEASAELEAAALSKADRLPGSGATAGALSRRPRRRK